MNNLFSKSPETYEKFLHYTEMILTEQRHQRADMATIKRQLHSLINMLKLQTQVDEYFSKDEEQQFSETSPQTDSVEQ